MMARLEKILLSGGLILFLAFYNFHVWKNEKLIDQGTPILLALGNADPGPIFLDRHIPISYVVENQESAWRDAMDEAARGHHEGFLVFNRDERGISSYDHLITGTRLVSLENPHQVALHYRWRGGIRLPGGAWFFADEDKMDLAAARYAVLKVGPHGQGILVGLADGEGRILRSLSPIF